MLWSRYPRLLAVAGLTCLQTVRCSWRLGTAKVQNLNLSLLRWNICLASFPPPTSTLTFFTFLPHLSRWSSFSHSFFARLKTFTTCLDATSKCFWWTFGSLCWFNGLALKCTELYVRFCQLPFFSPFPVPGSLGTNVFAQRPSLHRDLFANPYAFLPIILIPDLLRFLSSPGIQCTLVIPDVHPRRFWLPILKQHESFILAEKGSKGIVFPPTTLAYSHSWALPWDLGFQVQSCVTMYRLQPHAYTYLFLWLYFI